MAPQALIVGGGLGGLAAAVACHRAGWQARLFEQAPQFSEVGAGIQLGPNATRILAQWGLADALSAFAAFPAQLRVRSARDGALLAAMPLASAFTERYGAPYACVHRADLQALLLAAAREAGVHPQMACRIDQVLTSADGVRLRTEGGTDEIEGAALVGADGLWSSVRSRIFGGAAPQFTGHLAFRCLALQADLPQALRSQDVIVWLGPRMHLVAYPVRRGELLNVVAFAQGAARGSAQDWDQAAVAAELQGAMGPLCSSLQDLVQAMPHWRLWLMHDRPPVAAAGEMARGRVALLGDAAHPMLPYFAQGAGMAIEDAMELGRVLSSGAAADVPTALHRYALARWQRCSRVQALSRRNGRIFHAAGWLQRGRDLSLRLLGERLLDQPWLYGR